MKYTTLPDEFDMNSISIMLDFVRKKPVDSRAALVAAINVVGYAGNTFLPSSVVEEPVVMGVDEGLWPRWLQNRIDAGDAPCPSDEDCAKALEGMLTNHAAFAVADPKGFPWLVLLPLALKILKLFLPDLPFKPA